jgi:hypothetical protein
MLLALQLLNLLADEGVSTAYPSVYAGLSPVVTDDDEADLPTLTNLGTAATWNAAGQPTTSAAITEYFTGIRVQRSATGDWHPSAWRGETPSTDPSVLPPGFTAFVGGTVRAPLLNILQATAISTWQAMGYTVVLDANYNNLVPLGYTYGQVVNGMDIYPYDLLRTGGTVTLHVSLGAVLTATVRAYRAGHYGGLYRYEGDVFVIAHPEDFSAYWMTIVSAPDEWLPYLPGYVAAIDRSLFFPLTNTNADDWYVDGVR